MLMRAFCFLFLGKPENQNHAIIFTRGEHLQAIDMNQSNYFEEALKMRNLLEEFNVKADEKRVGIVGFREHIYTGGLSSIANFMALQEGWQVEMTPCYSLCILVGNNY